MDASSEARLTADPSRMQALEEKLRDLEKRLAHVEEHVAEDRIALVVFSGDLDRVLAAFVIATGAAAVGQQVSMFFTFWGLSVLKKDSQLSGKTGGLNGSSQHLLAVYSQESQNPKSFADADLNAAPPCRALTESNQTSPSF